MWGPTVKILWVREISDRTEVFSPFLLFVYLYWFRIENIDKFATQRKKKMFAYHNVDDNDGHVTLQICCHLLFLLAVFCKMFNEVEQYLICLMVVDCSN